MKRPIVNPLAFSRRTALQAGSALGLSLASLIRLRDASAAVLPQVKARSVVILYLSGGPSQLDMWDLKPDAPAEIRGAFRPIGSSVPGVQICEHLPRMARLADKFAIVRSMSHREGDHLKASYLTMTGGPMARPVVQASGMQRSDRPHAGAVISRELNVSGAVPPFGWCPNSYPPSACRDRGSTAAFSAPPTIRT